MTIVTEITIYLIGIIVCTIWLGVWARMTSQLIDEADIIFFCAIIALWPIGLCFAVLCLTFFFFLVKPLEFLIFKIGDWYDEIVKWWNSRKDEESGTIPVQNCIRNCDVYRTVEEAMEACHKDRGYCNSPVKERESTIRFMLSDVRDNSFNKTSDDAEEDKENAK